MKGIRVLGITVGLAAITSLGSVGVATAKPLDKGTFHDEFSDTIDLCDSGLIVEQDVVVDGRFNLVAHGPDGLAYYAERLRVTDVRTNPANGKAVTSVQRVNQKDLKVTDNGDGTLTLQVLATGNDVLYGPDGKAIARNPGQVRFDLLIDHAGTPADPSDDEFLEFLGITKGSTGRTDDFCTAALAALS